MVCAGEKTRYVAFSSKNSCDTENKLVELVLGLTNH